MKELFRVLLSAMMIAAGFVPLACGDDEDLVPATDNVYVGKMEEGKIQGCSGKIAYQRWMTQENAEATLVFLNGRTEYTDKYHHLVGMMDRPWNIIMFDHFGQGRSDGPRAHADDFEAQHVCDLGEVIEQLAPEDVPIVVVAHSMGAFVATRFAELNPGVAKAYVFSSPMYGIEFPYDDATVKQIADTAVAKGNGTEPAETPKPREACADNEVTHDCELYDEFKDDPLTLIGPPTWGWLAAYFPTRDAIFAQTSAIAEPVMVFQAGQETVVIPEAQNELCDKINADHDGQCQLEVFPDDRHEIFNEIDRAVAVDKMLSFFDNALAAD